MGVPFGRENGNKSVEREKDGDGREYSAYSATPPPRSDQSINGERPAGGQLFFGLVQCPALSNWIPMQSESDVRSR